MEPRLRASHTQFAALVEFMEKYGDQSKPQPGPQGRIMAERRWQQLTSILNAIGDGVQRTPDKWKKVWTDWKSKTKVKVSSIKQHAGGTGGGPPTSKKLSALEERVAAIMGETALSGQPGIQEQGLNTISQSQPENYTGADVNFLFDDNSMPASVLPESITETRTVTVTSEGNREASPLAVAGPSGLCRTATRDQASTTHSVQRPRLAASPQSGASTPRRRRRLPRPRPDATSPPSAGSTPRRARVQPRQLASPRRRTRTQTPFQRAASEFAAVEMRRLELEHEREARRIEVDREHNQLLREIINVFKTFVEAYRDRI